MSLQFEEDPGKFIEIYNYRITILKSLISTIPLHFHDWLEFLAALDNMNLLYDDILRADNHVIRLQQYLLEMSRCNVGWYQQLLSMNLVNELMDISSYSLNSFASNYLKKLRATAHDTPISAQDDEDDDYNDGDDEDDEDYEDYEDDEGDEDDEDDEDDDREDDLAAFFVDCCFAAFFHAFFPFFLLFLPSVLVSFILIIPFLHILLLC